MSYPKSDIRTQVNKKYLNIALAEIRYPHAKMFYLFSLSDAPSPRLSKLLLLF